MSRFKPLSAAVLGLVLSAAAAHAEPPALNSGEQPGAGSLAAMSQTATKIGDAINTGAQALGSGMHRVTDQAAVLIEHAKNALGVRYQWGGTSASTGFDCSGFVRAMVEQTIGKLLPHRAADQAAVTQKIGKDELQPGDLVFFNTVRRRAYSHVGIYMGDGQFIHAPSRGKSVRIDNLSAAYWQKHFGGARRVLASASLVDDSPVSLGTPSLAAPQQTKTSFALLPDMDTANVAATASGSGGNASLAADVNIADAGSSSNVSAFDTPHAPAIAITESATAPKPAARVQSASKRSSHAAQRRHVSKPAATPHGSKR